MDRHRRADLVAVALMAVPLLAALVVWPDLPARMAIHWRGGTPDTVVGRPLATGGLFAFGVATVAFTRLAPPALTNTPGGPDVTVLFVGVVFAWIQATVVTWNLGYHFDVGLSVLPVLVLAGLLVVFSWR